MLRIPRTAVHGRHGWDSHAKHQRENRKTSANLEAPHLVEKNQEESCHFSRWGKKRTVSARVWLSENTWCMVFIVTFPVKHAMQYQTSNSVVSASTGVSKTDKVPLWHSHFHCVSFTLGEKWQQTRYSFCETFCFMRPQLRVKIAILNNFTTYELDTFASFRWQTKPYLWSIQLNNICWIQREDVLTFHHTLVRCKTDIFFCYTESLCRVNVSYFSSFSCRRKALCEKCSWSSGLCGNRALFSFYWGNIHKVWQMRPDFLLRQIKSPQSGFWQQRGFEFKH